MVGKVSRRSRVLQEVSEKEAEVETGPNYTVQAKTRAERCTPERGEEGVEVTRRWTSETRPGYAVSQTDESTRVLALLLVWTSQQTAKQ